MRLIQDDQDVMPMCKPNEGRPRNTIILYVENGNAPLAVEVPDGTRVGTEAGVRGGPGAVYRE